MTPSTDTLMLGRGVKRKWSCLEEEEEPEGAGLQRHDESASQSETSRLQQQRQLVLGLCLEKLQRYQVGVELSLRRSVLLVNTLRQIQEDMRSEGQGAGPDLTCAQCAEGAGPDLTCAQCAEGAGPDLTCAQCAEGAGPDLTCAQCTESEGAGPLPLAPPLSQESDGSAFGATGYLGDLALDDIFDDIDTSMYEASDLWAAGVSLWADEDAKARSPPPPAPSHGALQSCLMDLNELDHIMEILVQS